MNEYNIYTAFLKPDWAPPAWVFGPAWSFLYLLIAISFGVVFYAIWKKQIPAFVVIPFVLNLIFNFAFTPILFGLENNFLASIDVVLTLLTIVWAMIAIWPYKRWVTYMQIPYLAWVSFASILQLSITYLNW